MKTYQHHITKVGENVWRLLLQRLFLFCWCCKSEIKPKLHTNDCKKKITILKLFCILQVHVVQVAIIVIVIVIMIMMMMMTTLTMTMTIIDYYYYLLLPQKGNREYRHICLVHSDDELYRYHTQVPLLLD